MAIDVDAFLLDRVFQPCADRLASVASCFGLARTALVLACESQALTLFWDATLSLTPFNLVMCASVASLTGYGGYRAWQLIQRIERQSRTGTMNVRRITLRGQRMTWLGVCALCSVMLSPNADIRAVFAILGCVAWVAVVYFLSCTPMPPAERRSFRMSAALS